MHPVPKLLLMAVLAAMLCCTVVARAAPPPTGLAYIVHYSGDVDANTLELLQQISKAETLRETPPESALLLERRAQEDKAAFKKVFDSNGHFAASITSDIDQSVSPAVLTYRIDPGPQFELRQVFFRLPEGKEDRSVAFPDPAGLGLAVPEPFRAKAIVDAEAKLVTLLRHQARPFAKVESRRVTADFADHCVTVNWIVDPGPKADFGPLEFKGLTSVKERYLTDLVPWNQGQPYDAELLIRYRRKLADLNLFTLVQVEPGETVAENGQVPVVVTVTERKHRTIKGGLDYKTDEGPGANLGWEHRNLFGGGEKLSITVSGSAIERLAQVDFEKPDLITPKDLFKANAKVTDEDKKAYKGQSATATASIRRQVTDAFSVSGGLGYRTSRIEEDKSRPWEAGASYGFVFVPVEAAFDNRDNPLDPQKGFLGSLAVPPYLGILGNSPNFLRPELSLATYFKLADTPGTVLATRVTAGTTLGAKRDELPPDLRYYAGGGGSIRGYPYQTVGPLRGKTPLGGDSVLTFSAELRLRITELIGVVPFVDGGTAFAEDLPPYRQPLLLGAGLGIRVYTPIGPIRLDLATPVTRRKDIDDIAQFYFSIGQSF